MFTVIGIFLGFVDFVAVIVYGQANNILQFFSVIHLVLTMSKVSVLIAASSAMNWT